jgi:hypothetical protein
MVLARSLDCRREVLSQIVGLQPLALSERISAVTLASRRLAFIKCVQWTSIFHYLWFIVACTACRLFSNVCRTPVLDSMKALTCYTLYRFRFPSSSSSSRFSRPSSSCRTKFCFCNKKPQSAPNPCHLYPLSVVLFIESTIPKDFPSSSRIRSFCRCHAKFSPLFACSHEPSITRFPRCFSPLFTLVQRPLR